MSEETNQYKISVPLLNVDELVKIDNYYNEIVDEFAKESVKEKEDIIKQRIMMNLRKENQQLKEKLQQKEDIINKAKEYVKENVYREENGCGSFWWEITNKDELLEILNVDKEA